MKKLLLLATILLIIGTLNSCTTKVPENEWAIPELVMATPERPLLQNIPSDTDSAIVAYSLNMVSLMGYAEKLEYYLEYVKQNRDEIIYILTE